MRKFEHVSATSLGDAVTKLGEYRKGAVAVAGGTDILGVLKDEVHPVYPRVLVDLKGIGGLDFIREEKGGIKIGALTTLSAIARSDVVRKSVPLLADAAHAVASPQLRNMGTLGGNICQEPRCWYYRGYDNVFHCLRKGGDKCPALTGENRFHSIFGSMRVGAPGCSSGCPDSIDIPRYMERIREGRIEEAGRIILENNPMPAVTGRVCPHFCEQGCNRTDQDSAVSIRAVERRVGDYILENAGKYKNPPAAENGKKVAIVGGGPAGLSCAYYLRRRGFGVVVYDKQPKLGGMLRYGIPDFRLSQGVLDRELDFLLSTGIVAKTGQRLGKDFTLDGLRKEGFDAVFLAMGSWVAKGMGIENESHASVVPGISFLEGVKWNGPPALSGVVAVVGGGNTAIDAARTALRCGAKKVVLLYRRTRPEMPAEDEEIEDAIKEGVELQFLVAPKKAVLDGKNLVGLECAKMRLGEADASGRPRPVEIKGSDFLFKADWVISAIGQDQSLLGLDNASYGAIKLTKGNGIEADEETFQTSVTGVFAGGDVVTGPATAVEALAAGRKSARSIAAYLTGDRPEPSGVDAAREALRGINAEALKASERVGVKEVAPSSRCLDAEDYATLDDGKVGIEAHRCLDCSCVAVNASDVAPALVALGASVKTTKRTIAAEDFYTVGVMATTVLEMDELVTEIFVPAPKPGTRFSFQKFRIRNSIDFPIVSVASALTFDGATIKDARIVFGAVAPIPLRAVNVEEALVGKAASEETAEAAGAVAARQVFPLEHNRYKVQILKGLLRKAILAP
ncbi:MAG: FAD-dependent oxidoreductase [Spirochaetes bacterium]|nr:FAD-dependent oxidoreductase [Spirochaetota bacterium]MBU1082006.1 FAD-dependent oxidoreductase [Spirochaetota bacterium]